ncbi:hypothetical protein MTR67_018782 [Solanum verrucosum]|uniref:Pectin acetylesterase n=1 Tax=Solanum verrucosum TaxID=315347 RepID=A0AAF0QME6_SOLVR|nr:hypothetical protein MTR67_018782 [Solanum verrucosum]
MSGNPEFYCNNYLFSHFRNRRRICLKVARQQWNRVWYCFFPENIIPYIETPLFIINSAYDAWQTIAKAIGDWYFDRTTFHQHIDPYPGARCCKRRARPVKRWGRDFWRHAEWNGEPDLGLARLKLHNEGHQGLSQKARRFHLADRTILRLVG